MVSENVYSFIPQIPERKQLSIPKIESPEGYYEEAEPYDTSLNGTSRGQGWGLEGANHFLHGCQCWSQRAAWAAVSRERGLN